MNNRTDAVINEIEKVIIGKREVVERVLMAILSEGHILLDDVPGVGKTTLAVPARWLWACSISVCSLRRMLCRRISLDSRCTTRRPVDLTISRVWL